MLQIVHDADRPSTTPISRDVVSVTFIVYPFQVYLLINSFLFLIYVIFNEMPYSNYDVFKIRQRGGDALSRHSFVIFDFAAAVID